MTDTRHNGRQTNRDTTERDTDTDASAGWREEYALQEAPARRHDRHDAPDASTRREQYNVQRVAIATDGGTETERDLPEPGERVRDRDGETDDELVVVETHPDTTALDYEIDAIDATVAAVNSAYDPTAPVVEAVYVEDADDTLDGWRTVEDLRDAVTFDVLRAYSFPADRLARLPAGERR